MNWMKLRYLYLGLSALIIIPGLISLLTFGLKLSIDFTGGSILKLESLSGGGTKVVSQTKTISQSDADKIVADLKKDNPKIKISSFETIGPALGQETIKKTAYAIAIASLLLLVHIGRAFKQIKFGICAVLAMLHDSLILLGIFSLLGHLFGVETDLLFVTAMLTVLSFSVHDTIVVYDRIRELRRHNQSLPFIDLANQAVSETMIRSLNNSLTIIFMLLALVLLGGETTKFFALALLIGTISGTYSSPFTAVPLLVIWEDINNRKRLK